MTIYAKLTSTETEKMLVEELNKTNTHLELISRQYGEMLREKNQLKAQVKKLEKQMAEQRLREQNSF